MRKISKNTALLGAAIGLGLLCFVGAQWYFRTYLANAEKELASTYEKKQVIVAKVPLKAGATLSAENLAVRTIPKRYLASGALVPDDLDQIEGQKLAMPMEPGDPIDRGLVERADRGALSTTVEKGERAITIPVDEVSSSSGMLVPGDVIDLMYTGPGITSNSFAQGTTKELTYVRALLEAVPVIATGKTTQKRTVRTAAGESQEVNMDFTTVTLKVTPDQAERVLLAQRLGQLTAVLRNPEDKTPRVSKEVLDEMAFKRVGAQARAGASGPHIEMIIGGTGAMGGVRMEAEIGKTLLAALGQQRNAATQGATAKSTGPDAGDVRSRLGISMPQANPSTTVRNKP